jgi:diadenosine tetraphosphate (Ap4A) HIT family hydrolase
MGLFQMKINETPWTDRVYETEDYIVFKDGFPVTEGHLLFVPKVNMIDNLVLCWKAAYAWAEQWIIEEYCDGYNIGQNIGSAAGQTVMYPHVHLIPRRHGDMKDPRGGVRHVIPEKGNYRANEE